MYTSPSLSAVTVSDAFLAPRMETNHTSTLPMSVRRCEETGRIDAFHLVWKPGMPNMPHIFWDSDVAKVVEGMALELLRRPDPALEARLEEIVALIVSAQQPDGYLNTHYTVVEPDKRWSNLKDCHELYCAGHLMEAAVAHFQATGRRNFLDCMCRYADYIATVFGRGKGQKRGYPGHEEIELALVKLARASGNDKYLKLAKYFVDERGQSPNYYVKAEGHKPESVAYNQADKPVREQTDVRGHAVRAVYLYSGMADVAAATGDAELLAACRRLFDNLTERKMYVTGGIGSTPNGEAIENAYKLPNALAYAESCAGIGLVFFAQRMHNITGKAKYIDVLERALYNNILAGLSLSGDEFFYQNPLRSSVDSPYDRVRQKWFWCSCCPTNFCRFLPQIGTFLWSADADEVRLNIPAASTYDDGARRIRVTGGYPYDGAIRIEFLAAGKYAFSVRLPGWCHHANVPKGGRVKDGYLTFRRAWKAGDVLAIVLDMPVEVLRANPGVDECAGKLCLQRGPLVYALEGVDNRTPLHTLAIPAKQAFAVKPAKGLPKGTLAISGVTVQTLPPGEALYTAETPRHHKGRFTAIPYALWQNRGETEMQVWTREAF